MALQGVQCDASAVASVPVREPGVLARTCPGPSRGADGVGAEEGERRGSAPLNACSMVRRRSVN
jgi:hypothetical protein